MKKIFVLFSVIICTMLWGCKAPQFIVTSKEPTGVFDNCIIQLKPINSKAEKLYSNINAMVKCDEYKIGDTLTLTRKNFTNY